MPEPLTVPLLSQRNEPLGEVDLPAEVFNGAVRRHLLYEVVRMQRANRRAGTHATKNRALVSGSGRKTDGKKPYYIKVNDRLEEVHLEPLVEVLTGTPEAPEVGGAKKPQRPKPAGPGDVTTSLPGKVTKVLVKQGQAVKKDDLVLIVEAMKMESQVLAPITGAVKTLYVKEGDDVKPDETLLVVE